VKRLLRATRRAVPIAILCLFAVVEPSRASLTEGARLAAVYDSVLNAQFDRASVLLKEACPPAPVQACQALGVASLWWQIQINPESRLQDQTFSDNAEAAIAASEAWTRREPERAEAWFYLAGSYAPLVQWRVLRGEHVTAAREAARIKSALERALQLDPELSDAQFGIGLYHYYAAVAPAPARLLRWLLWLPGGDRVKGLREMLAARDRGELLRGEATFQLHVIYLWYERQPDTALQLLERLDAMYPFNPIFLQRIAELRDTNLHDHEASAQAWRTLLDRAERGQLYTPSVAEVRARIGLATELAALDRPELAIDQLKIVVDRRPTAPVGARAYAESALRALIAQRARK